MIDFACYQKIGALMVAPFRDSSVSVSVDCRGMQRNRILAVIGHLDLPRNALLWKWRQPRASRFQRLAQHRHRPDVIGQDQHQACVERMTFIHGKAVVPFDECLVEIICRLKVGVGFKSIRSHEVLHVKAVYDLPHARSNAALTRPVFARRQRAHTCWSGRSR